MKNIALIIPNLGFGGAQNALIGLYTELKKRGYFVKIIAFECDNTFEAAKYKEDLIFLPIHQSKSIFKKFYIFLNVSFTSEK